MNRSPFWQTRVDEAKDAYERGEWCIDLTYGDEFSWCDECLRNAKVEVTPHMINLNGVEGYGPMWQCIGCFEDRMNEARNGGN